MQYYPAVVMKDIYEEVLRKHPDMKRYFPHYFEEYVSPRDFFWPLYRTMYP